MHFAIHFIHNPTSNHALPIPSNPPPHSSLLSFTLPIPPSSVHPSVICGGVALSLCFGQAQQKLKSTESDRLQVQIQAYLDNVFDVGQLMEDSDMKTAALERVANLEEALYQVGVMK